MTAPRPTAPRQRRLVVHIGMPKAGSTTIQKALAALEPQLRERGVEMPRDAAGRPNPLLRRLPGVVPGLDRTGVHHLARGETWAVLAGQLRGSNAQRFVISDEGLLSRALAEPPGQR